MSRKGGCFAQSCQSGFSLIELMVAMSILAVLLVILMSIVDATAKLWRQNENRVDSYREARAALNIIANDLSSMYVSANTDFFKFEDGDSPKLTFLSAMSPDNQEDDGNRSDLCEVSYQLHEGRTTSRSASSFNLYRGFRSSKPTSDKLQVPGPLPPDPPEEVLARNIAEFKVEAFSVDPSGATTKFDPSNSQTPIPDLLVIKLVALNQEAASRLKGSQWSDKNLPTIKQNSRIFTTRVRLRTQGITFATPIPTPVPTPTTNPAP